MVPAGVRGCWHPPCHPPLRLRLHPTSVAAWLSRRLGVLGAEGGEGDGGCGDTRLCRGTHRCKGMLLQGWGGIICTGSRCCSTMALQGMHHCKGTPGVGGHCSAPRGCSMGLR